MQGGSFSDDVKPDVKFHEQEADEREGTDAYGRKHHISSIAGDYFPNLVCFRHRIFRYRSGTYSRNPRENGSQNSNSQRELTISKILLKPFYKHVLKGFV